MTVTQSEPVAIDPAVAVATWDGPSGVALRATLILLPGRGESPQVYERFGRRLAADAYRVHVITAPSESTDQAGAQLADILGSASVDAPRVLVGSDTGAAYAAHLASQERLAGVSALVLAGLPTGATEGSPTDWDSELDLRTSCPTHRGRITEAGVNRAALFADIPAEWLDPTAPGRITVPTLGVHGRDDAVSPVDSARRWYADVARAEFVTVAGGRHDVLNDQTHRTVAATIVLFLERLRAGADLAPLAVTEIPKA